MIPLRIHHSFRIKRLPAGIVVLCFCGMGLVSSGCGPADRTDVVNRRIGDLTDANENVRQKAAWALGAIKDPRAVEPLITALKDADGDVRRAAALALGEIKDPRAVEPLIAALKGTDILLRHDAAQALGKIGLPAAESLFAALKDTDFSVQQSAAEALGIIKDPRIVESLIATLKDANGDVRQNAAEALGMIKAPRAIEPLLAALKDEDQDVAENAARALGRIGTPAVESLIATLKGSNQDVRRNAAEALGMITDRRASEFLLSALKESDLSVVAGAYWFFIQRGKPGSEKALIQALDTYGNADMARSFLNCGNAALEAAGKKWAQANGYYTMPELRNWQPGRWGDRK